MLKDTTYTVSTCPVEALKQMVSEAIRAGKKGKKRDELEALLTLLETDGSDLSRWYVLEELIVLGVKIDFAA